MTETAR